MHFSRTASLLCSCLAPLLGAGCASSAPESAELLERVRASVEHQECEAITLVHALASAQRDAANASWDFILNAAAQNFRTYNGMSLDAELSEEQRAAVNSIARQNLSTILKHVAKTEATLIEALGFDYECRGQLLESLVRDVH